MEDQWGVRVVCARDKINPGGSIPVRLASNGGACFCAGYLESTVQIKPNLVLDGIYDAFNVCTDYVYIKDKYRHDF